MDSLLNVVLKYFDIWMQKQYNLYFTTIQNAETKKKKKKSWIMPNESTNWWKAFDRIKGKWQKVGLEHRARDFLSLLFWFLRTWDLVNLVTIKYLYQKYNLLCYYNYVRTILLILSDFTYLRRWEKDVWAEKVKKLAGHSGSGL